MLDILVMALEITIKGQSALCLLLIKPTFCGVIDAKVSRPVDDDALHRHVEALIQAS